MSLEENKKAVEKFFTALRTADIPAIDAITTDDFTFRAFKGEGIRKEQFLTLIEGTLEAFPDHTSTIDDMIAEGDKVAVRMTASGTLKGQWGKFPPTDKYSSIPEFFFLRLEGGKIAEYWGVKDALGQYQQLGILPEEIGNQVK